MVTENKDMIKISNELYKDLFKGEPRTRIALKHGFFSDLEKVSQEENNMLVAPFSEEEIKIAVLDLMEMEPLVLMVFLLCSIKISRI